jgi:hypothetical protein
MSVARAATGMRGAVHRVVAVSVFRSGCAVPRQRKRGTPGTSAVHFFALRYLIASIDMPVESYLTNRQLFQFLFCASFCTTTHKHCPSGHIRNTHVLLYRPQWTTYVYSSEHVSMLHSTGKDAVHVLDSIRSCRDAEQVATLTIGTGTTCKMQRLQANHTLLN